MSLEKKKTAARQRGLKRLPWETEIYTDVRLF